MVPNAILLVRRAQRDGGDDSTRLGICLRAYVDGTSAEAVELLHAVRVSVSVAGFTVDQGRGHRERETTSWWGYERGGGGVWWLNEEKGDARECKLL